MNPSVALPFPLGQNIEPSSLVLIDQGAEALLYRTTYLLPTIPCALKYRPPKSYRHPTLDARLTRHRVLSEARVLVKCRRAGVKVPAIYHVDGDRGWMMMEWIVGPRVKDVLSGLVKGRSSIEERGPLEENGELCHLLERIGRAVARLHAIGVIHGDLTTSNLMLHRPAPDHGESGSTPDSTQERPRSEQISLSGDVVLIDFGLAAQSVQDEDRAVDLYVLERAFGSTHPKVEPLFGHVLKAYGTSFRGAHTALKRLEDVRMRGRKKSMIG